MAERKATWQNDSIARTYDRMNLTVAKGEKKRIAKAAANAGQSVNAFMNRAISNRVEGNENVR